MDFFQFVKLYTSRKLIKQKGNCCNGQDVDGQDVDGQDVDDGNYFANMHNVISEWRVPVYFSPKCSTQ